MLILALWSTLTARPAFAHGEKPGRTAERVACSSFFKQTDPREIMADLHAAAGERMPQLREAVAKISGPKKAYFALILRAAEAAMTKHHAEFLEEKNWLKLNTGRHAAILSEIGKFNPARVEYSLFQIKRIIDLGHSIEEYANCKED